MVLLGAVLPLVGNTLRGCLIFVTTAISTLVKLRLLWYLHHKSQSLQSLLLFLRYCLLYVLYLFVEYYQSI